MKKLKPMQKYPCGFCAKQGLPGVPAVWRAGDWTTKACDAHQEDLRKQELKDYERSQHMTEADYQTWDRL